MAGEWTPEPFEADDGTIPFQPFVEDLSDVQFAALATAIQRVLCERGIDLVRTEWLKALGQGLHEFRVRHHAGEIARMFGGDLSPHHLGASECCSACSSTSTATRSSCCSASGSA